MTVPIFAVSCDTYTPHYGCIFILMTALSCDVHESYKWGKPLSLYLLWDSMFWLSIFSSTCKITDAKSTHPQFFPSHSALIPQLWTSCLGKSSSCKDRVGGLSCSSLSLLAKSFCIPDAPGICPYLPSRSSFSKLVPCSECAPRLSTTASSSFLCWAQTHYISENHRNSVSWTWSNTLLFLFPFYVSFTTYTCSSLWQKLIRSWIWRFGQQVTCCKACSSFHCMRIEHVVIFIIIPTLRHHALCAVTVTLLT